MHYITTLEIKNYTDKLLCKIKSDSKKEIITNQNSIEKRINTLKIDLKEAIYNLSSQMTHVLKVTNEKLDLMNSHGNSQFDITRNEFFGLSNAIKSNNDKLSTKISNDLKEVSNALKDQNKDLIAQSIFIDHGKIKWNIG